MPDYRITLRKHIYSASLYTNCVNATAPKLKYVVQYFMLFPMIYSKLGHKLTNVKTARINKVLIAFVHRITLRKHRYSVGVYEKSVFPIVPKLDYIIQYFMIFPTMYSKLGHKLTNVKTASINKVLIAFVHKNYTPQTSIFTMRLCRICLRNYSQTRLYCAVFTLFPAMFITLRNKLANVKVERINKG